MILLSTILKFSALIKTCLMKNVPPPTQMLSYAPGLKYHRTDVIESQFGSWKGLCTYNVIPENDYLVIL